MVNYQSYMACENEEFNMYVDGMRAVFKEKILSVHMESIGRWVKWWETLMGRDHAGLDRGWFSTCKENIFDVTWKRRANREVTPLGGGGKNHQPAAPFSKQRRRILFVLQWVFWTERKNRSSWHCIDTTWPSVFCELQFSTLEESRSPYLKGQHTTAIEYLH